ncbi:hypothetical protein CSA80_03415 [Candidatus Saccharibacteria bacterium]|nr:MAG: hypothetical protein CSA80_03415 [Candidatus Saccharibacteria bacterium]
MHGFIFDPQWDDLVLSTHKAQLAAAGVKLHVVEKVAPLSECAELFAGGEPRILCVNPDYVGWKLEANDYRDIPNLKAILGAATSFSWIDTSYADEAHIPVCNVGDFSTQAVAEWAVMMMFNVARQTPRLIKDGFLLDYDKDFMKYRGVELHGKTVGLVGLGHIGSAIAQRCAALGMNVTYWSRSARDAEYAYKELPELFGQSDVIFPTMAINDETKSIISDELLCSMKPTAMLISVVHELFSEQLVLDMVRDGRLYGFAYETGPSSFDKHKGNVWAAPAYAWATDGSMNNLMTKWVENMVNAADGKFPNRVN